MIRKQAAEGPNFAGHYTVAIWGCGTSCAQFAIVDNATGEVFDPPFDGVTWGDERGDLKKFGIHFGDDSSLLIVQGCPEEKNCAARYYNWDGRSLRLLHKEPVDRFPPIPEAPPADVTVRP